MAIIPFIEEPKNEPVLSYAPGTPEREELKKTIEEFRSTEKIIKMHIGGEDIETGNLKKIVAPHEHSKVLGYYHEGDASHVEKAIGAAMKAWKSWSKTDWQDRVSVFLKAAELAAGKYRQKLNAATMLGQSKNPFQAEIDSACELIDFFRFNAYYAQFIYEQQPASADGIWNRMEYRPLEGFIAAITPFNFTSIAANLPGAPALMGNVVLWKPARTQVYSARVIMDLLIEAGLPEGVINLVLTPGKDFGNVALSHPDFAGLHFTGSTATFQHLWRNISENLMMYKNYPRIVGETGGKDFIYAHPSADIDALVVAMARGAYEYQGQKCSAASRAFIPESIAEEVIGKLIEIMKSFKMGPVEDFTNFINAVIDEKAFDKIAGYIDYAKKTPKLSVLQGGNYDKSVGYFIEPTLIKSSDPYDRIMCEEIFGPILSVYVYKDNEWESILKIIDESTPYGLTGAIFAQDRNAIIKASETLRYTAGNYYINDKPTGAVVNQQPFGGARASGTNDKAGSYLNLIRWISPRTIKENFNPPKDWKYPFMQEA